MDARRARAARIAGSAPAPSSKTRPSRQQPAPQKAAPAKAARKKATATEDSGTERVYRRMPADFAAVYRQAGSAAAVADHYGVPRYTAHGWISRFKKQDPATTN
ncbi:hypothetical protein ACIA5D_17695 [Actinoplanes sp. NPDC051513]|uniref:hypothetical protein n=1 Tax=Actinoplanes sp. NPDC051513 TaxID=3363908 RepID=UPI00379CC1E5